MSRGSSEGEEGGSSCQVATQHLIILQTLFIGMYIILCRINAYIEYGLDKDICNPYDGTTPSSSAPVGVTPQLSYPEQGCSAITSAFNTSLEVPRFNNAYIVAYFVTSTVEDRLPALDF